jgi:hypothetical protein
MLKRECTDKVRYWFADSAAETDQLIAELPEPIRARLEAVLDLDEVVLRYDKSENRAYFIARQARGLVVWIWDDIKSLAKAGQLLASVARLDRPLSEDVALGLYGRATG